MMIEWEDKIPGGKADKSKPSDFDPEQLRMGIEVEMEHTKNRKLAKEIAMDHLREDPKYYSKLKKVHKESVFGRFIESALKHILKDKELLKNQDPFGDVNDADTNTAAVRYHSVLAGRAKDKKVKERHLSRMRAHAKVAHELQQRHGVKQSRKQTGESLNMKNDIVEMIGWLQGLSETLTEAMKDVKAGQRMQRDLGIKRKMKVFRAGKAGAPAYDVTPKEGGPPPLPMKTAKSDKEVRTRALMRTAHGVNKRASAAGAKLAHRSFFGPVLGEMAKCMSVNMPPARAGSEKPAKKGDKYYKKVKGGREEAAY